MGVWRLADPLRFDLDRDLVAAGSGHCRSEPLALCVTHHVPLDVVAIDLAAADGPAHVVATGSGEARQEIVRATCAVALDITIRRELVVLRTEAAVTVRGCPSSCRTLRVDPACAPVLSGVPHRCGHDTKTAGRGRSSSRPEACQLRHNDRAEPARLIGSSATPRRLDAVFEGP